ncbi:MAG: tRNA lysidine(34) synthetase TilS [Armatimonadota bacterium]|nr:tRNA lysidine(34) synthetase TilS [bacterium]
MESEEQGRDILPALTRFCMLCPGDRVLAAVSGGPDSVTMLHALHTRADELGISLHVAHLNHGIRGEASNLDEDFVRELAQQFGLEITVKRVDVPRLRVEMRMGEEEAARTLRYKFLQDTVTIIGAKKIAVGHNADDRAESVLLNVIRGTGIDGLGAIRPVRGNIIRPLIGTTRAQIEKYIEENRLPFRVDQSNLDMSYSRNRVRHELIPLLETSYNPQIRAALNRLADIATEQSELTSQLSGSALAHVALSGSMDAELFVQMPIALQRQVLRSEIERLKGDLVDVTLEQVDRVLEALCESADFTITLPSGRIYAVRKGTTFRISTADVVPDTVPFDQLLEIPGATRIPAINMTIDAEVTGNLGAAKLPANEAFIDFGSVRGMIRVRSLQHGDRIVPLGMKGSKKLQDVFVDKKIPKPQRARVAVLVDAEKIIWVPGVVSSELVKVTGDTQRVLHLIARR